MQNRTNLICYSCHGIGNCADAGFDTVDDAHDQVFAPIERLGCKPLHIADRFLKAGVNDRVDLTDDAADGGFYIVPDTRDDRLDRVHHRGNHGFNAVPSRGHYALDGVHHCGDRIFNGIPHSRDYTLDGCQNRGNHGLNCCPDGLEYILDALQHRGKESNDGIPDFLYLLGHSRESPLNQNTDGFKYGLEQIPKRLQ